jgi:hypothetical protein
VTSLPGHPYAFPTVFGKYKFKLSFAAQLDFTPLIIYILFKGFSGKHHILKPPNNRFYMPQFKSAHLCVSGVWMTFYFFKKLWRRKMNNLVKPEVVECLAENCGYNRDKACHATAINVGGPHQECDTFIKSSAKGGMEDMEAGVGACKVTGCGFNKAMLCSAKSVKIGMHGSHADCQTFKA